MKQRVYDDRTNDTLFAGHAHEAIQFISEHFNEEHEDFPHIWVEQIEA